MRAMIESELKRFANTVKWSLEGWQSAWATEKSLRQWTVVNVLNLILAFVLPLSTGERALVIALGLLVLAAELMNTALEEVVDYLSKAQDPRAKRAKDCGSAAVAITAIAGGAAWLIILVW